MKSFQPAEEPFPSRSDFNQMVQNPRIAFRDPALHEITIERTKVGLPRARAGAFADVYRGIFANNRSTAVRIFASYQSKRQERYKAIHQHLSKHRLACLVPFTYADDGVRAPNGRWYPLITMEWVQGSTLFDWLQKRAGTGDKQAIGSIAEKWQTTIKELNRSQIAHGDLQHANVMITDVGEIKLVDYDGMCVPQLVGRPNLEIGVEPYQHPDRNGDTKLSLAIDNFSAVFIYVGLRALSAEPRLWKDFVVQPGYEKMMFRKEDLLEPRSSPLIQRLRKSPDGDVQRLATTLAELTRVRMDQVPFLDELLFSFDQVRVLLDNRDFDAAVQVLTRHSKQVTDAPPDLQPRISDAQQRIAKLGELASAVAAGNEHAMMGFVMSPLLQGYPKASDAVAAAADAPKVVQAIQKISAAKAASRWREVVREWDAALPVLKRPRGTLRKSAAALSPDVESWRQRNGLCDEVLKLVQASDPDAATLQIAWKKLKDLGGHPECDAHHTVVEKVVRRDRAWRDFCKVRRALDETTDHALVQAWNEADFGGWPKAEAERGRVADAAGRLRGAQAFASAATGTLLKPGEEQLLRLAAALPSGYSSTIDARVDTARNRLDALSKLVAAVAAESDSGIVNAFRAIEALHGTALVDQTFRPRIDTAVARDGVLEKLRKIPTHYSVAQAGQWDAKLLATWVETLLLECREATAWRSTVDAAICRKKLLAELDAAVGKNDAFRAYGLSRDPSVAGYPFAAPIARYLAQAATDVSSARGMQAAISQGDHEAFVRTFSARILREHTGLFATHWPTVLEWTRSHVLPRQRLGLQLPIGVKALENRPGGNNGSARYVFRWKWPDARFTDECRLAICRNTPPDGISPEEVAALLRIRKTRELYQSAGGYHPQEIDAAWKGAYVVIWARIDLGAETLWSEPLVMGRV